MKLSLSHWYPECLIVSIPDLCPLSYFVLHERLRCGSLSITTSVSLLADEFDVRSVLLGQVSLAAVNRIGVIHEVMNGCKNIKIHLKIASKM